jgi:hypothetical protein
MAEAFEEVDKDISKKIEENTTAAINILKRNQVKEQKNI